MSQVSVSADELVGFWSVEHGFHSSMEDECLMFRADGTAWYEYARPGLREYTLFRWRLTGPGQLEALAYEEVTKDDDEQPYQVRRSPLEAVEQVGFSIALANRPLLDEPVRELVVRLSFVLTAPFAYVRADEPGFGPEDRT